MIAIFDLDGTLALNEHRQHFLEEKPKNWRAFHAASSDDAPNKPVVDICNILVSANVDIYILTGRPTDFQKQTKAWLVKYCIEYDRLLMRKSGDYRDDTIVKRELLRQVTDVYLRDNEPLANEDIIIFEDRQKVVDMWREMGLACCQVAPGDF